MAIIEELESCNLSRSGPWMKLIINPQRGEKIWKQWKVMKIHFHLAILITHLPQLQRVGDTAPVFTGHQINTKFCSISHQPLPKSVEDHFFHPTTPPHHFDVLLLRSVGVIIATTNERDGRKKRKQDNNGVFNIAKGAKLERRTRRVSRQREGVWMFYFPVPDSSMQWTHNGWSHVNIDLASICD